VPFPCLEDLFGSSLSAYVVSIVIVLGPNSQTIFRSSMNTTVFSERELTFMFAIRRLPSVCRLSVVCNVRAPYSAGWNFR